MKKKSTGDHPSWFINHLDRDFSVRHPKNKWVANLPYIQTQEIWLYLCVVIDLFLGMVVGWSMSVKQDRQWVFLAVLWRFGKEGKIGLRSCIPTVELHSASAYQSTLDDARNFAPCPRSRETLMLYDPAWNPLS